MKINYLLLSAALMLSYGAHAQVKNLPARKTADSLKVIRNTSEIKPAAKPAENTATQPVQNRSLEYVGFQGLNKITNQGFAFFRGMNKLKILNTHCWSGITDEALLFLEECPALESLYLVGSNITDTGLNNLLSIKDKLPDLTRIYVNGSKTTREGETTLVNNWGNTLKYYTGNSIVIRISKLSS